MAIQWLLISIGKFRSSTSIEDTMFILAVSILADYGARRILPMITDQLEGQITATRKQVKHVEKELLETKKETQDVTNKVEAETNDLKNELYLALYEAGWQHAIHFEIDKAIETYQKAIKLLPNRPEAYAGLAEITAQEADLDQALTMARKAVELSNHKYPRALLARAAVYCRRKDFELAKSDLEKARELSAEESLLSFSEGNYFLDREEYNDAERAYTKAIDIDPNYVAAYYNRACSRIYLTKYDEALADLERVVILDARRIPFALRDPDLEAVKNHPEYGDRFRKLFLIRDQSSSI